MQSSHVVPSSEVESEVNAVKQYLVKDEKFELLKQCQKDIFNATEMSPSIRKLINDVITIENLSKVKEKHIKSFKE